MDMWKILALSCVVAVGAGASDVQKRPASFRDANSTKVYLQVPMPEYLQVPMPEELRDESLWGGDLVSKEEFTKSYEAIVRGNMSVVAYDTKDNVVELAMDYDAFKEEVDKLVASTKAKFRKGPESLEQEKARLEAYLGLPAGCALPLEDLRKEKASLDICGCQLLVEGVKREVNYRLVNEALLNYLAAYEADIDALTRGPFLYTLMRMLTDHSRELATSVKDKLPSVSQCLGAEFNAEAPEDLGAAIYQWLLDKDPDALGEYHR